jgi:hypothetical protein
MQIYDQEARPLRDLIRDASTEQGATLLVPDLQRPYVWSPTQVTLLVDSLLRGWPFGTLLLWDVRREDLATIPSRPFWKVVDRTDEGFDDETVSRGVPPAHFRMVLDGQQRLQSLLLAFAGDGWGFRLLDREWSTVLESERPKGRNAKKHWSLGHLCLDIPAFQARWEEVGEVTKIEFREVLQWVVLAPQHGRSTHKKPVNYREPLASALDSEARGRFLRLSRLWALAAHRSVQTPRLYREDAERLLLANDVDRTNAKASSSRSPSSPLPSHTCRTSGCPTSG